jgi:hypothetical protein
MVAVGVSVGVNVAVGMGVRVGDEVALGFGVGVARALGMFKALHALREVKSRTHPRIESQPQAVWAHLVVEGRFQNRMSRGCTGGASVPCGVIPVLY